MSENWLKMFCLRVFHSLNLHFLIWHESAFKYFHFLGMLFEEYHVYFLYEVRDSKVRDSDRGRKKMFLLVLCSGANEKLLIRNQLTGRFPSDRGCTGSSREFRPDFEGCPSSFSGV
jgi:hypothetical protein